LKLLEFIDKKVVEKAGADGDILGLRLRDGVGGEVRLFGVETLFEQRYKD